MDHEKAERLRIMLQEALQPLMRQLDHLEKEVESLKELLKKQNGS